MSAQALLSFGFFERVAELTAAEEDKLTHLDYGHEMAFITPDEDTGHILVLVRLKDQLNEKTAEFGARGSRITGSAGC